MKGLALLAALPLLAACRDPGAPNGERGVLFFEPEFLGAVGESLSLSITMPRHVTLGDYPKSIDRVEHYDYDFDGTVLEFPEAYVIGANTTWSSWRGSTKPALRSSDTEFGPAASCSIR